MYLPVSQILLYSFFFHRVLVSDIEVKKKYTCVRFFLNFVQKKIESGATRKQILMESYELDIKGPKRDRIKSHASLRRLTFVMA